jgi:acetyl-CoA synthetase
VANRNWRHYGYAATRAIPTKPGSATLPFPGILADIVDIEGNTVEDNQGGYLVVRHPWPGMMRTLYGDPERFRRTYWEHIPQRWAVRLLCW